MSTTSKKFWRLSNLKKAVFLCVALLVPVSAFTQTPTVCLEYSQDGVIAGESLTLTATVDLPQSVDIPVAVNFGNFVGYVDPTLNVQVITIPAGNLRSTPFKFTTRWDGSLTENFRSFVVGTIAQEATHPLCLCPVLDIYKEKQVVTLSSSPNPVKEGNPVTVTATISKGVSRNLVVPLHYPFERTTDTAIQAKDYSGLNLVTIPAWSTTGTGTIRTYENNRDYQDKAFTVAINSTNLPHWAEVGVPSLVTVTIEDDDATAVSFDSGASTVNENTGIHEIVLNINPVPSVAFTVNYSASGSAIPDLDYTVQPTITVPANTATITIPIKIVEDSEDEINEVVRLALVPGTGYRLRDPAIHELTIVDNDARVVEFTSHRSSVGEGDGMHRIRIRLSTPSKNPFLIKFELTGSATPDVDYISTAQFMVPPGLHSMSIPLEIVDDTKKEENETVNLTLLNGTKYLAGSLSTHTTLIMDNEVDVPPAEEEEEVDIPPAEEEEEVDVPPAEKEEEVDVPPAEEEEKERDVPPAEEEEKERDVPPAEEEESDVEVGFVVTDTDIQTDEIDIVEQVETQGTGIQTDEIKPVKHVVVPGSDVHVDEVLGVDQVTISLKDNTGSESVKTIQLPIELNRPVGEVVTVQYATTNGTAKADQDYVPSQGIVIFEPGATQGVIEIEIVDDNLSETTETVTVTLSNSRNVIIARRTGTATILDNDGPNATLQIRDVTVFENETAVRFKVSVTLPQPKAITITYQTLDGTAKAGSHYQALSGMVTLPPGATETEIIVPLLKDKTTLHEKTFSVHLKTSSDTEIVKAVGVATIQKSFAPNEKVFTAFASRFARTSLVHVTEALEQRVRFGSYGASCGVTDRVESTQPKYSTWSPSIAELLSGCRMAATTGSFGVWANGAFQRTNNHDQGLTLNSEIATGIVGSDYHWTNGWLTGILLVRSQGKGTFKLPYQTGKITAELTGIYPYMLFIRPSWNASFSIGTGNGQIKTNGIKKGISTQFGMFGVQGILSSRNRATLNYYGNALIAVTEIANHEKVINMSQTRVGIEAKIKITKKIRAYVKTAVRKDGGNTETGTGLEIGGGMQVFAPEWKIQSSIHAQRLVVHTATGFSEWGVSGYIQIGNQSNGLMLRVRPTLGTARGLSTYDQSLITGINPINNSYQTQFEVGYSVPVQATKTVRSIASLTRLQTGSIYRLGTELHLSRQATVSVFGVTHGVLKDSGISVGASVRP